MSSENNVKSQPLVFGVAGTQTQIAVGAATPSTATSNAYPLPRQDFTLQPTVFTTGTSGVLATVVHQASNDNAAWFAIGSSTASATSANGGAVVANATSNLALSAQRYAYGRSVITLTGTGSATVFMGS